MLFVIVVGILVMLLGGILIACEDPKAEQKKLMVLGIFAIVFGIVFVANAVIIVTQGWVLERENFLDLVSKDSYLIKNDETYVYRENYPSGEGKTKIVEEGEGIEVEICSIDKGKMAYVLVSKKVELIHEKQKYVFYIPEDSIDEN